MKKRILLIEPDQVLANIYYLSLKSKAKVQVVYSAQAAIIQMNKNLPDLIILEPRLIDHNGIEFLYELRSYPEWQEVPVIVLSFDIAWMRNLTAAKSLGIVGFLPKVSTNLAKLRQVIDQTLALNAV